MGSCGFGWSEGRLEELPSFHANFTFHEQLGKGSFGSVFIAEDKLSLETLAVKVQSARRIGEHTIKNEASTWRAACNHENVCRLFGLYQEADVYFAVMERCKSSMWDRLVDHPKWTFKSLTGDIEQILEGLQYIHSLRVVHRDIKAENILLGGPEERTWKIADFGLAIKVPRSGSLPCKVRGSAAYMAPEMLAREGYSFPADVWSFGVLCFVMLMGHFPCGTANMAAADMKNVVLEVEEEPARVTNGLAQLAKEAEEQANEVNMMKKWTEREVGMVGVTGLLPGGFHGSESELSKCQTALFCTSARLEVLTFAQSCLQRKLSARQTTKEALKAPLFQPHHEWLVHEDVLVVNRKALKRPPPVAEKERCDQKLERKDEKQKVKDKQAEVKERRAKIKEEVEEIPSMDESSHGDRSQRLQPKPGEPSSSAQRKQVKFPPEQEVAEPRAENTPDVQHNRQREVKQGPSYDDEEDSSGSSEGSSEEMYRGHRAQEEACCPQQSSSEEQSIDSVEQDYGNQQKKAKDADAVLSPRLLSPGASTSGQVSPVSPNQIGKGDIRGSCSISSADPSAGHSSEPSGSSSFAASGHGSADFENNSAPICSRLPSAQSAGGSSILSGPGLFSVAAAAAASMDSSEGSCLSSVNADEEVPDTAEPMSEADRVPEQPDDPAAEFPELADAPAPRDFRPGLPCELPPELV
eukprot:TRINITY_DN7908_c0_g2_i2.p1 TRINITY_DN7908_c0_g2~~TRINITY_DN7908_c0_g2_i2.p1  ORF type:complete len:695 (+),score=171.52 TRINITY_DN7908_c0_g2_i2:69-2153(+)